jgi:hypothetical protein
LNPPALLDDDEGTRPARTSVDEHHRNQHGPPEVYDEMATVIDRCFRHGESLSCPTDRCGNSTRSLPFVDRPDLGSDTFLDKLSGQLRDAGDDVILLMAELHYSPAEREDAPPSCGRARPGRLTPSGPAPQYRPKF